MPNQISHLPAVRRTLDRTPRRSGNDWRCCRCGALLGIPRDGLMHVSFARGHEYLVSFPATATCRRCGTLNQATGAAR